MILQVSCPSLGSPGYLQKMRQDMRQPRGLFVGRLKSGRVRWKPQGFSTSIGLEILRLDYEFATVFLMANYRDLVKKNEPAFFFFFNPRAGLFESAVGHPILERGGNPGLPG